MAGLVATLLVDVLVGLGAYAVVRTWARRQESGPRSGGPSHGDTRAVRVHRLRSVAQVVSLVGIGLGIAAGLVGLTAALRGGLPVGAGYGGEVASVVLLGGLPSRGVRPSIARLREVPLHPPGGARRAASQAFAYGLLVGVGGAVALGLLLAGASAIPAVAVGLLSGLLAVQLGAPAILRLGGARPLPPPVAARVAQLADRMGVRGVRLLVSPDHGRRTANAYQMGILPGSRCVVLTEHLLDHLDPTEVDAVAAHELGHARGHHVLLRLLAGLGAWAVLDLLVAGIGQSSSARYVLALLGLSALPFVLRLVTGLTGIPLERRADAAAVRAVGAGPLAGALGRLEALNDSIGNPGRVWTALSAHPGMDTRISGLRAEAGLTSNPVSAPVVVRDVSRRPTPTGHRAGRRQP